MRALLSLILMLMSVITECQSTIIIAHRGASYDAPENTLASVNLAWEKDADAVEIDVHLSKDNRIMVIHDEDTKRTAGRKLVIRESLSNDLRNLEVGSYKDPKYTGERIPFLEEVIRTVPGGKMLFIEVKSDTSILPFLAKEIQSSYKKDQLNIISFDFEVVAGIKQLLPGIPAYWLHSSVTGGYKTRFIEEARKANLDGLNFHYEGITEAYVAAVHEAGMKIFSWTVDDPEKTRRLIRIGIDGITTNRPAWLKEQLN